jgi:hypothetical protein
MGLVKTLWKLRYILLIVIAAIIIYNTILKIQAMAEYIRYLLWFVKAEGAAALAQKILNGTMLLCPLFWIVLGVIAVIAIIWALVANWDKVSAWLKRCWAGIKNAFKSLWNSIWKALDSPWLQTLLTIFFPFIGIPIMIIKNWGKIKKFFSSMWKGVVDTFFWAIRKIKSVWGWLVGGFDKVAVFLHLKPDSKGKKGKQGKPAGKPAGIPAYAAGTDYVPEAFSCAGEVGNSNRN